DLLIFPSVWKQVRMDVKVDQIVVVRGKVQFENEQDTPTILADSIDVNLQLAKAAEEDHSWQPAQGNGYDGSIPSNGPIVPRDTPELKEDTMAYVPPPPPAWEDDEWEPEESAIPTTAPVNGKARTEEEVTV